MNMSYCRFQNTLGDFRDCAAHLEDDEEDMSPEERRAKKKLIELCRDIGEELENLDEE